MGLPAKGTAGVALAASICRVAIGLTAAISPGGGNGLRLMLSRSTAAVGATKAKRGAGPRLVAYQGCAQMLIQLKADALRHVGPYGFTGQEGGPTLPGGLELTAGPGVLHQPAGPQGAPEVEREVVVRSDLYTISEAGAHGHRDVRA